MRFQNKNKNKNKNKCQGQQKPQLPSKLELFDDWNLQ
jgi:hypothetical protein